MSSAAYYALCLAAGLLATALASALIVRHLRWRAMRQATAIELLDALARYHEWVALQGRAVFFQAGAQEPDSAVQELGALQAQWFPELRPQADVLLEVHLRLTRFLRSQYQLRLQDAEAWFESDPDAGYMSLWREHCEAVESLEQPLAWLARGAGLKVRFTSAT